MAKLQRITCFEHQRLKVGQTIGEVEFTESHWQALSRFHHDKMPYYQLIHRGVKFQSFVGVLQVGNLVIEVLPKADKNAAGDTQWQTRLVEMLRVVGILKAKAPTSSSVSLKSGFILDVYFELFCKEMAYLLKRGLVKQYRKTEGNQKALKGSLHFSRHLQQNLIHQERFYVRHTTYDTQHLIHQLLRKTLRLIRQLNQNPVLSSEVGKLLLYFPEMPRPARVTQVTFNKIPSIRNRNIAPYQNALDIARLLLLNYHPDVSQGQNHVLALMFDMNRLWEKFIEVTLRQFSGGDYTIKAQQSKRFWESTPMNKCSHLKPDIVLTKGDQTFVLDTKWKNVTQYTPSSSDLQQLYSYLNYFKAQKVALVYPGTQDSIRSGVYVNDSATSQDNNQCLVITLAPKETLDQWQNSIREHLLDFWIGNKSS
ncbi:MAG TPA: restriction endonuclease [Microscillaceae bacterium]|nr:restriction endonuclease [Microscillaceae bacterium]